MTKGQRIKKLRTDCGLSQVEFASKLGISKQLLYKYENDIVTNIPSDKVFEIATLCESTPEYIMGWSEDTQRKLHDIALHATLGAKLTQILLSLPEEGQNELMSFAHYLQTKYGCNNK